MNEDPRAEDAMVPAPDLSLSFRGHKPSAVE
jgi:hypothetical protein